MSRLAAAELTTSDHVAEIASGLGELVSNSYFPVLFEYSFSSCDFTVALTQLTRSYPHDEHTFAAPDGLELPGIPIFNALFEKKKRSLFALFPLSIKQVSFYQESDGLVAYEAELPKWGPGPSSIDRNYHVRQELHTRKAAGDFTGDISSITVDTVRMIDRFLKRCTAKNGIQLNPGELDRRNHAFWDE